MRQMAKANIVYHNMRLNLDNEQHRRIHVILTKLNMDVHRSINQFMITAMDFYIQSLNDENQNAEKDSGKEADYALGDLEKIRMELKDELKDEMIILLGAALVRGTEGMQGAGIPDKHVENAFGMNEKEEAEPNPLVESLVDGWG